MNEQVVRVWIAQARDSYMEAREQGLHYPQDAYIKNYVDYMTERWEKHKAEVNDGARKE